MSFARPSSREWIGIALIITVGLIVAFGALALSTSGGGYYGMMGTGGWGWGMAFMALLGLFLVLILVFALVGWGERPSYPVYPAPPPAENALDVLDRRYARGEVTREQYTQMRADLEAHAH